MPGAAGAKSLIASSGGAVALISKQVLLAPAATITFPTIPQIYNQLRLMAKGRSAGATGGGDNWQVKVNAIAAGYDVIATQNTGTALSATSLAAGPILVGATSVDVPNTAFTAGVASDLIIDIPNYTDTVLDVAGNWLSGFLDPVLGESLMCSAIWKIRQAAAVNALAVSLASAANFVAGSAFYLYGIT